MNADWKVQNELIFAQPSNLRFVRGGSCPQHSSDAIEVHAPRQRSADIVVILATLLAVILGLYFNSP